MLTGDADAGCCCGSITIGCREQKRKRYKQDIHRCLLPPGLLLQNGEPIYFDLKKGKKKTRQRRKRWRYHFLTMTSIVSLSNTFFIASITSPTTDSSCLNLSPFSTHRYKRHKSTATYSIYSTEFLNLMWLVNSFHLNIGHITYWKPTLWLTKYADPFYSPTVLYNVHVKSSVEIKPPKVKLLINVSNFMCGKLRGNPVSGTEKKTPFFSFPA